MKSTTGHALLAALLGALAGCAAPNPAAISAPPSGAVAAAQASAAPTPSEDALPLPRPGPVRPVPPGCLAMIFVAPGDDRNVVRNERGRITDVITPTGRKEPVLARILWDELESLVPLIADIVASDDPERISHIPSFYSQGHMPGPVAWDYLRRFLKDSDAAWTFGEGETGLMITRDNQPICFVYVRRPFSDDP